MGHHLTKDKKFKSDKYIWCPEGFIALKFTDKWAQIVLLVYSWLTKDEELGADIRVAVEVVRKEQGRIT